MRIVRDTVILVREHDGAKGPTRNLLLRIIESDHELARVLRYPRMLALTGFQKVASTITSAFCARAARSFVRTRCRSHRFVTSTTPPSCKQPSLARRSFFAQRTLFRAQPGSFRVPGASRFVESASELSEYLCRVGWLDRFRLGLVGHDSNIGVFTSEMKSACATVTKHIAI